MLKYIKIGNSWFPLCIFDQIKIALVGIRNLLPPKLLNDCVTDTD